MLKVNYRYLENLFLQNEKQQQKKKRKENNPSPNDVLAQPGGVLLHEGRSLRRSRR